MLKYRGNDRQLQPRQRLQRAGVAFLPFLPMLPLHIRLIRNLLCDVSVAIPFDNVDDDRSQTAALEPGRSQALYGLLWTLISSIFDILTFGLMWWCSTPIPWGDAGPVPSPATGLSGCCCRKTDCTQSAPGASCSFRAGPPGRQFAMTTVVMAVGSRCRSSPLASATCSCRPAARLLPMAGGDLAGLYGGDPGRRKPHSRRYGQR